MFLKQLNDSNQSFKVMKINISRTTCRSVLKLLRRITSNSLPAKSCFPIFHCVKIHLYSFISLCVLLHNLSLRTTSNISLV